MTNRDFITKYIKGEKEKAKHGHLGFKGNYLVNYSTVICVIDRENRTAFVNNRKYSMTTSKLMSEVRYQLRTMGFDLIGFEGTSAEAWNFGYCGASGTDYQDIEYAIEKYNRMGA